ncbi:MAG: hypothetical protein ACRDKG_06935, partial [Actinomycetota bacterium]
MSMKERWALDEGFRVLSYTFRIRTTSDVCAELVLRSVAACRDPSVGFDAPAYRLEDGDRRSLLTLDDQVLLKNARRGNTFQHLVWHLMNNAV